MRFGLKHTLPEVVVVLIANITPLRRVMFALETFMRPSLMQVPMMTMKRTKMMQVRL